VDEIARVQKLVARLVSVPAEKQRLAEAHRRWAESYLRSTIRP
jgi:hypothetical protein